MQTEPSTGLLSSAPPFRSGQGSGLFDSAMVQQSRLLPSLAATGHDLCTLQHITQEQLDDWRHARIDHEPAAPPAPVITLCNILRVRSLELERLLSADRR